MDRLSDLSFLVVDDNRHMVGVLKVLLEAFGVENIHESYDVGGALTAFSEHRPDIVIVDYNMAPLSGVEFVRQVRRAPESPNPYVPILLVTAHTERRRMIEARDAGVTEVLTKPVTAQDLYARIHSIIYQPRPFIASKAYVGPCRRCVADPVYDGPERRLAKAKTELA
jgi:two-component system chemotaxis response regulator CheY